MNVIEELITMNYPYIYVHTVTVDVLQYVVSAHDFNYWLDVTCSVI